ncbi:MAG: ABC transporter permease [Acidobacteriota bacterium]
MNRLLSTMAWDARLQVRNGFYAAAAGVAVFFALLLSWPDREALQWILPAFVFGNLQVNTFYFLGGMVLLEKREGTLEAQIVTPLATWEYLTSKLVTLTALGLVENLAIVAVTYGFDFHPLPFLVGMLLASLMYALIGFALVARYDSINEYLMPSVLVTLLLAIPLMPYFGYWPGWWHALHPLLGPLLWMRSAFEPVSRGELIYGLLYSLLWIALLFRWSQQAFYRFIITKEGTRGRHAVVAGGRP